MTQRYTLHVVQLDPLWRVTVREMGRLRPEFSREYPSQDEALAYAKGRGEQMRVLGESASVLLKVAEGERLVWDSAGADLAEDCRSAGCRPK